MTHAELVERAGSWLKGTMRCCPVIIERNCWSTAESPDAFGVNSDGSVVVECKASVSDFYADRAKPFRVKPEDGMGRLRFYMTPKGLIRPERLTLVPGWGLIEVWGRRVMVKRASDEFKQSSNAESLLMRSAWLSWAARHAAAGMEVPKEARP